MENTVKNKVAFIISMTIIGVAVTFIIIGCLLAFLPVTIAKTNVQPYVVTTKSVKAGEQLIYIADVCKFRDSASIVTRTFVDQNNVHYPLPEIASNVPSGCHKNKVVIPTLVNLHAGTWYLTLDVQYKVNVLRNQTYHFRTETFEITK